MQRDKSTIFFKYEAQGESKFKENRYEQALKLYDLALQYFTNADGKQNKIAIQVQRAKIFRIFNQIEYSYNIFIQCEKNLQNAIRSNEIEDDDFSRRLQYSISSNLALLIVEEIIVKINPRLNYQKYRFHMNQALKYYNHSQIIVVECIQYRGSQKWWRQQYLKLKSNKLGFYLNDAELFGEAQYIQHMLKEVEVGKNFYNCYRQDENSLIHLYRCYYFKAICLRMQKKYDQSLKCLLQDYKFQKKRGLKDALKTKNMLLIHYLDFDRIEQAKELISDKKQSLKLLQQIVARRKRIKRQFSKSLAQIKQFNQQVYQQLMSQMLDEQDQYRFDYLQLQKYLNEYINLYDGNYKLKGMIYYYLAEIYFKLDSFQKSKQMATQALKLGKYCSQYEKRERKISMFAAKIRLLQNCESIYKDLVKQIQLARKSAQNEIQLNQIKEQENNINNLYSQYKMRELRKRQDFLRYFTKIKKLITFQNDNQQHIREKRKQKEDQKQTQEQKDPKFKKQNVAKFAKSINNPEETYKSFCQKQKIIFREQIFQLINKKKQSEWNPLTEMINLTEQQIKIFVRFLKIANFDLRNHQISTSLLQFLAQQINLQKIETFKINNTVNNNLHLISAVLQKLKNVKYLSFVNFSSLKKKQSNYKNMNQLQIADILKQIYQPGINYLKVSGIKVLKLKYCNLKDKDILKLNCFKEFSNLEQLSLSHNKLEGSEIGNILMYLKSLKFLNISFNKLSFFNVEETQRSLQAMDIEGNSLISLKLRGLDFQNDNLSTKIPKLLGKIQVLDLSYGKNVNKILQEIVRQLSENIELEIKQFCLRGTDLIHIQVQLFKLAVYILPSLETLDIRGCNMTIQMQQEIESYIMQINRNIPIRVLKCIGNNYWKQQQNY